MLAIKGFPIFIILALMVFLLPGAAALAQENQVVITSPVGGEALQGVVAINGSTAVEGFRVAEISFAYQSDPTGTWFLIQQSSTPIQGGVLASWDTTMITDDTYKLRVQVFLQDGQVLENQVTGVRVRNYTPVETSTPAATAVIPAKATVTPSPLPDYQPAGVKPKPLPTNPAELPLVQLERSAAQGAGLVLAFALLAGIYIGMRALFRR